MSNWYYYDSASRKQGPFSGGQLRQFVQQGIIAPETVVETEEGKSTPARKIKGLTFPEAAPPVETKIYETVQPESPPPFVDSNPFSGDAPLPFVQTVPVPPPVTDLFCTNCGQSISAQAVACMSCGAKPIGHKKFCRQCGTGLNPEQVICVKCGTKIAAGFSTVAENLSTAAIPKAKQMVESVLSSSNMENLKKLPQPVIFAGIAVAVVVGLFCLSWLFSSGGTAIVGKWAIAPGQQKFTEHRFTPPTPVFAEKIELLKDGTGIIDSMGGTWKTEKGRFYFTAPLGAVAYDYTISGSTLTLKNDKGRAKYRRQRR